VTWPDPELLAGADVLFRPLLDELDDLEPDELEELDALLAADLPDPLALVPLVLLVCWPAVAWAEPGRL